MKRRDFIINTSLAALAPRSMYAQKALNEKPLENPPCDTTEQTNRTKPSGPTGIVIDHRFLTHVLHNHHPESPKRLKAISDYLHKSGIINELHTIPPRFATKEELGMIHSTEHIDKILSIKTSGTIASLSAGAGLAAIDALMNNEVQNAFCAIRPPGHHALNNGIEDGFCYFNNVAIAARYIQTKYALKNILIIDWDYHHGNSTEWAFYDDPTVLFFSTHDKRAYPGTGDPSRIGKGAGEGFNVNVHLSCGSQDSDMYEAWDRHLEPLLHTFKPECILISAGFDSRKEDTLGCFNLSDLCFSRLTQRVLSYAKAQDHHRVVSFLEGGYNVDGLARAVFAHVSALHGSL